LLLTRGAKDDEDCPQVTHPLGADAPEDVGVELAERLVRDSVAKSDRQRQRLLRDVA
jgi:hypothetical protein